MKDVVWNGEFWEPRDPPLPETTYSRVKAMLDALPPERLKPWDYRHLLMPPYSSTTGAGE